jgi:glycosyltransferase involved in cell wall biosynthesis
VLQPHDTEDYLIHRTRSPPRDFLRVFRVFRGQITASTVASPTGQLPLAVAIIAKNEAHNLPRCLASVQGWVAEIVVVLNDTTDASESIARAAGAAVHHLPWRGYRDTKNAATDLTQQPWVLSLDADEEVSPALRADISAFLARSDRDAFAGARFPRKVWFIDRWITHGDWYPDLSLRLFHRDRARWGGDAFVHEKIECRGPVATLRGYLHHFSFPTLSSHVAKINPFADLFVRQQQAKGKTFSLAAAVFRPAWRFFRAYVLKLGFLDGFPGFYIAWATAFGAFVRYSRLYETEHRRDPTTP